MSQDGQLDILGTTSIEELLKEKEKYKKGLSQQFRTLNIYSMYELLGLSTLRSSLTVN